MTPFSLQPPRLLTRRVATLAGAAGLFAALLPGAHAQAQPQLDSPLRIVVGYAPGGATDRVARIVGDKLAVRLGVPVVVDNKPGAGGRLAAQQVKTTPANQNVLMLANPAVMVVAPLVFKDNGYEPERDFVPVSHVNDYDFGWPCLPRCRLRNWAICWPGCAPTRRRPTWACRPPAACRTSSR